MQGLSFLKIHYVDVVKIQDFAYYHGAVAFIYQLVMQVLLVKQQRVMII